MLSFILLEIHSPAKHEGQDLFPFYRWGNELREVKWFVCSRSQVSKCPSWNWNWRLLTSVTQHSVVTSSPGYTRVKPEPSRYAKCFSLILQTTRKQVFTRTQVRSIINQKSILRNIKPPYTEGTEISVNCSGLSSTFIECLLYPRYCVWDTEQIRPTRSLVTFQWVNEQSRSSVRLLVCILPTVAFCLVPTVPKFFCL